MFTPAVILVNKSPANAPAPDEAALQALWRRVTGEPAPFIPLGPNVAVVDALLAEYVEGRLTGKGDRA